MSDELQLQDLLYGEDPIPLCCRECQLFAWDYDEYRDINAPICERGVRFPVRKQACKRQKPFEEAA